jgi:tetratricopeptide (TPR) repeat protein
MLLAGLSGVDAAAQTGQAQTPTTREVEQPQREVRAGVQATDAARAARGLPDIEGGAVTFEEVMRDPDNIDLNYRYAQTQIALGEVRGAAATLERILLLEPNLPRVRLLYAVVLFRLDNLEDAEREFARLRALDMPATLRAEIDLYVDEIRKRRQRTRVKVLASVGGQYDTNRNAGPGSGQLLFSGVQIPATGTTRARGDFSVNGIGRVDVSHDLGFQDRHKAVGAITYYDSDQVDQDSLDLRVVSGEAGFAFDLGPLTLTPQATARYVNLARQSYQQSEGLNLTAEYKMTTELTLSAFGEAEYQRFYAIDVSTDAFSRTGWQYRGGVGAAYKLSPTQQISLDLSYLDKRAEQNYYAYRTVEATLGHAWLFPGGQFLLTSFAVAREAYDEPDPAISSNLRTDWRYRGRLTLGQPVAELFGVEAPAWWLRDLTLTATYETLRSESNITNYTYWNHRGSIGLSKRFDF